MKSGCVLRCLRTVVVLPQALEESYPSTLPDLVGDSIMTPWRPADGLPTTTARLFGPVRPPSFRPGILKQASCFPDVFKNYDLRKAN